MLQLLFVAWLRYSTWCAEPVPHLSILIRRVVDRGSPDALDVQYTGTEEEEQPMMAVTVEA